eukprot:jgi/Phyca11/106158/e_gw1.12.915.1
MWLVPFEAEAVPEVRVELKTAQYFYGLRLWNYNKSPEDTYRGVKQLLDIYFDDSHLFSGTLKKAPIADRNGGLSKVHKVTEQFGQAVLFSTSQAQVAAEKRNVYYCGVEEQDV